MTTETLDAPARPKGAVPASTFSAAVPQGRVWIDHTSKLNVGAETLHALLSDIDGWPTWTPGLLAILRFNKSQKLRLGTPFMMLLKPQGAPPAPVPCFVLALTPNVIEWGGGIGSSVIRHRFEITETGPGRCELRQLEYATGLLAWITRPIEKIAGRHDLGWSLEIERKFGASK